MFSLVMNDIYADLLLNKICLSIQPIIGGFDILTNSKLHDLLSKVAYKLNDYVTFNWKVIRNPKSITGIHHHKMPGKVRISFRMDKKDHSSKYMPGHYKI